MYRSGNAAESRMRNTYHLAKLYNIELEAAREERIQAETERATSEHLERLDGVISADPGEGIGS